VPGVLGTGALAGWLITGGVIVEIGPFYAAGMFAILLGLLLLPMASWCLFRAWLLQAPPRQLLAPAVAVVTHLPLAALCWYVPSSLLSLQIIRVVNDSDQPAGPIDVWLQPPLQPRHRLHIPLLQPHSSVVRSCLSGGEGVAAFRATHAGRTLTSTGENTVFLGFGQPMEARLTLSDRGQHKFEGFHNPRWAWLVALRAVLLQASANALNLLIKTASRLDKSHRPRAEFGTVSSTAETSVSTPSGKTET
jgi:hypothetical protein